MGSAADLGVALRGKFDAEGNYGYGFMIGNGSGTAAEKNKFKKYYGVLNAKPAKGFIVEAYADYEPADFDSDRTTLKGLPISNWILLLVWKRCSKFKKSKDRQIKLRLLLRA